MRSAAARLAAAAIALAWASPVLACDCVSLIPRSPRFQADLDRIAAYYPVAAVGVVEKHGYYWRFRPTREYRGSKQAFYLVTVMSDCSLGSDELDALVGRRVFLLLSGGHGSYQGRYEAGRCVNLLGNEIEEAIRARIRASCPPR